MEAIQTTIERTEPDNPRLPFYPFRKSMERIKERVRIEDYARELTELRFNGQSLRGICPVHGGENRSSFAVYPDSQRWFCFRCNEGGDVVDLCQAVEKHGRLWEAMVSLAQRYELDFWQRPESWGEWQSHKDKVRTSVLHAITRSYQRRLFRVYSGFLADIPDPNTHREEAERFWKECYPVALMC